MTLSSAFYPPLSSVYLRRLCWGFSNVPLQLQLLTSCRFQPRQRAGGISRSARARKGKLLLPPCWHLRILLGNQSEARKVGCLKSWLWFGEGWNSGGMGSGEVLSAFVPHDFRDRQPCEVAPVLHVSPRKNVVACLHKNNSFYRLWLFSPPKSSSIYNFIIIPQAIPIQDVAADVRFSGLYFNP